MTSKQIQHKKDKVIHTYLHIFQDVGRQKPMLQPEQQQCLLCTSLVSALLQQSCNILTILYVVVVYFYRAIYYYTTSELRVRSLLGLQHEKSERKFSSVRRASLFQLPLERAIIMMNLQTKFQGVRTVYYTGHTKYCAIAPKQFSTCQIFTT